MITGILLGFPVLAAFILLFIGAKFAKTAALVLTLVEFGIAVFAFSQFNPADISDFDLQLKWLPSYGIGFHIGMDGISLLLVLLTTFLLPLIVLSTFNFKYENPISFYSLILLMQAGLIGVFV
ncbi:MAG: NADH-quinone oxidoreductase subunit M, partial [Verrucomicrobia bacterium]|nr:NADH-quinone oxidoreductase subunit M [Cytophagales bacterium]